MLATDFIYDGEYLSNLGYMVCEFDEGSGFQSAATFSKIDMSTVDTYGKRKSYKVGLEYKDNVELEFGICKDPAAWPPQEKYFTDDEVRQLCRWLNRNEFHEFGLYDITDQFEVIYFNCTFNIELVRHKEKTAGLKLTMISDAPYGYGKAETVTMNFSSSSSAVLVDDSDDEGIIYPYTQITCKSAGTLVLKNSMTGCDVEVEECSSGEVITFSGPELIISSSIRSDSELAQKFNYSYPSIGCTFNNRENTFTCTLGATVVMTYSPVIKNIS